MDELLLYQLYYGWVNYSNISHSITVYTHTHTHTSRRHTYQILLIQSSIEGHQCCFHILATIYTAAVSIEVEISFQLSVLVFSGQIPRRGIARSHGSSIFNFLRHLHTVSHSGYLQIQKQCRLGFPFLPLPRHHLLYGTILMIAVWRSWGGIALWFWFATSPDLQWCPAMWFF